MKITVSGMIRKTGIAACLAALLLIAAGAARPKATIYTIGDSTMENNRYLADFPDDPARGWGQALGDYFNPRKIVVENRALGGRSSKSFIDQGHWDRVINDIKKGDYLIIQFGHNDSKPDSLRFTDPETTFKDNMRMFVERARAKGATPVIATSIVRRYFTKADTIRDSHGRYVPAAAEVAAELNVPLVRLDLLTKEFFEKYGPEDSKQFFIYSKPGEFKRFPDGNRDDTHLNIAGSQAVAKLFAAECARQKNPLSRFILKGKIK